MTGGKGADISLTAPVSLNLLSGGTVSTTSVPGSTGDRGNIVVKAGDMLVQGFRLDASGLGPLEVSSTIASNSLGPGSGGGITIESQNLTLRDRGGIGATISAGIGSTCRSRWRSNC